MSEELESAIKILFFRVNRLFSAIFEDFSRNFAKNRRKSKILMRGAGLENCIFVLKSPKNGCLCPPARKSKNKGNQIHMRERSRRTVAKRHNALASKAPPFTPSSSKPAKLLLWSRSASPNRFDFLLSGRCHNVALLLVASVAVDLPLSNSFTCLERGRGEPREFLGDVGG